MAVIIDDIQIDVQPGQESVATPALPQAAAGETEDRLAELLELMREREERLSCD